MQQDTANAKIYTRQESLNACIKYFNGDELAASAFVGKYSLTDNAGNIMELTPDDMHRRLAKNFARIEARYTNPLTEDEIYDLFKNFGYIIPQGSPMSAIGNDYQVQSASNCFVIPSCEDSYGGILKTDQEQVQLSKRRGGVGHDISNIRPQGLATKNAAKTTDGIAVFMERFSNTCREVAQGGRRGALMLTINVHHPEIMTFITIKRDRKKVTGANISIRLTDEFMNAVKNNEEYEQRWPVDSKNPSITRKVKAREVWDEIIFSAWDCAEPGLLFWDNALKTTPSDIYKDFGFGSTSTNPCGEIILSPYDSCRLLAINLFTFVENAFTDKARFKYKEFAEVCAKAQRLMDDLVDIEVEQVDKILAKIKADSESEEVKKTEMTLWKRIREACLKGRRTGLGITALGDALAAINVQYGSDESIKITEKIYKTLALSSHKSSIVLAKERGAFPVFNYDLEKDHEYMAKLIKNLDEETQKMYKKYGRRNIALTTTAPTGTVSAMTQTTSGIEPAFLLHYKRRKKINADDKNSKVDFVDELGDKWEEFDVYHHKYKMWMDVTGKSKPEESPYHKATTVDVDWLASVKIQAVAQKWVDHSISKTCNLPKTATKELVAEIYMKAWEEGCKGFTVYRDGCRSGVLVSADEQSGQEKFEQHKCPKRTSVLECDIHQVTIKGESWTILIGKMDGKPYEVFGGLSKFIDVAKRIKHGKIAKHVTRKNNGSGLYDLVYMDGDKEEKIEDIVSTFENPTEGAFTRTLSLALRHGAPVQYVVEQLQKDDKDSDMYSFSRVIGRVLKHYIKDGTTSGSCPTCSSKMLYIEGCSTCPNCGYSKCG